MFIFYCIKRKREREKYNKYDIKNPYRSLRNLNESFAVIKCNKCHSWSVLYQNMQRLLCDDQDSRMFEGGGRGAATKKAAEERRGRKRYAITNTYFRTIARDGATEGEQLAIIIVTRDASPASNGHFFFLFLLHRELTLFLCP